MQINEANYVKVDLPEPVTLGNGTKVKTVEVIPAKKLTVNHLLKIKVDAEKEPFAYTVALVSYTIRNGDNGLPLPNSFVGELTIENYQAIAEKLGDAENVDPNF